MVKEDTKSESGTWGRMWCALFLPLVIFVIVTGGTIRRVALERAADEVASSAVPADALPNAGITASQLALPVATVVALSLGWLGGGWSQTRRRRKRKEEPRGAVVPIPSSSPWRGKQVGRATPGGVDEAVGRQALEATQAHLGRVEEGDIVEESKAGRLAEGCVAAAVGALVAGEEVAQCKAAGAALAAGLVRQAGLTDEVAGRVEAVVSVAVGRTVDFAEGECRDLVEMARGEPPTRVTRAVEVGVRVATADLHAALVRDTHKTPSDCWKSSAARGAQVALAELLAAREGLRRGAEMSEREAAAVRLALERGISAAVSAGVAADKQGAGRVAGEAARRCAQVAFALPNDAGLGLAAEELADAAAFAGVDALLERSAGDAQEGFAAADEAMERRSAEHAEALEALGILFSLATPLMIAVDAVRATLAKAKGELAGLGLEEADREGLVEAVRASARDHTRERLSSRSPPLAPLQSLSKAEAAPAAEDEGEGRGAARALALGAAAPLLHASQYFCATYLRAYYEHRGRADESSREQEAAAVIQRRFRSHADAKISQQEMAICDAHIIRARAEERREEIRVKTLSAIKLQARFRGQVARRQASVARALWPT